MDWIKDRVVAGMKGVVAGFGVIFGLWSAVLVLNGVASLIGVSAHFSLPANWEWLINPFQGGLLVALAGGVKGLCCCKEKKEEKKE